MSTGTIAEAPRDERLLRESFIRRLMRRPELGAIGGAALVWIVFALVAGDRGFLTLRGTANYLEVASELGILAVAVALLMIGGEFDLSSGVIVGTTGMFAAMFAVHSGWHVGIAMTVSLVIALGIGALNGIMVVYSRLPSFIVTLGVLFALRGFNLWLTQRVTSQTNVTGINLEPGFELGRRLFASDFVHIGRVGFKVAILWFVGLAIVGSWVLSRTKVGNWVYGVGGNKEAARMVGVPTTATKVGLFMAVAGCGWIHGMIVLFDTTRANVTEGINQEFYYIIAAVLGGCLLTGGFGSIAGAAFGCLILGMTARGIPLAGWDNNLYFLFLGAILLIAAFSNEAIRRWSSSAGRPSQQTVEELEREVASEQSAFATVVEGGDDD